MESKEEKDEKGGKRAWWQQLADPFYIGVLIPAGIGTAIAVWVWSTPDHNPDYLPLVLTGSYAFTGFCTIWLRQDIKSKINGLGDRINDLRDVTLKILEAVMKK